MYISNYILALYSDYILAFFRAVSIIIQPGDGIQFESRLEYKTTHIQLHGTLRPIFNMQVYKPVPSGIHSSTLYHSCGCSEVRIVNWLLPVNSFPSSKYREDVHIEMSTHTHGWQQARYRLGSVTTPTFDTYN